MAAGAGVTPPVVGLKNKKFKKIRLYETKKRGTTTYFFLGFSSDEEQENAAFSDMKKNDKNERLTGLRTL